METRSQRKRTRSRKVWRQFVVEKSSIESSVLSKRRVKTETLLVIKKSTKFRTKPEKKLEVTKSAKKKTKFEKQLLVEKELKSENQLKIKKSIGDIEDSRLTNWRSEPEIINNSILKYSLTKNVVTMDEYRESREFSMVTKFCADAGLQYPITQVDVYVNDSIMVRFDSKKEEFKKRSKSSSEFLVFHGTNSEEKVSRIMSEGLKIGGRHPDVPVTHGTCFGYGVYCTDSAFLAQGHNGPMRKLILARAVSGTVGNTVGQNVDCLQVGCPKNMQYIFQDEHQLCPTYVVHY